MRGVAAALVVVAVTSADDATAQVLDRTSQPPAAGWTDHPIRPGVTSVKAVHFDELRARGCAPRSVACTTRGSSGSRPTRTAL